MSKLDAELARALEEPAPVAAEAAYKAPAAVPESSKIRNVGLLATLVLIVAGVVGVFMFGLDDAAIYSIPVSELSASNGKYAGKPLRLEGELTPGTLMKREQPCEYRFTMQGMGAGGDAHKIPVRYGRCSVPDTFRDMPGGGVQVTVEGTLTKEGHFEATLVMAKCSSKYDPATHKMATDDGTPAGQPIN